jgi:hypothetical protein
MGRLDCPAPDIFGLLEVIVLRMRIDRQREIGLDVVQEQFFPPTALQSPLLRYLVFYTR